MLEIRITAPELTEALNNLAKALNPATTTPNGMTTCAATSAPAEEKKEAPVAPAPAVPTTAVPTTAAPTTAVPTAAPQYTLEMIAKAGTALIDAGKMGELTALLAKYGVEALTSLNPAQYGVFAADLRAMGASI